MITDIMQSARKLGVHLWVDGGQLRYKSKQPVSPGLKDDIRQHKAEIIELLSRKTYGSAEPALTATGLPCGGCGSTTYTWRPNGYQYPDGGFVDGWHCGGPECHVKLMLTGRATRPVEERGLLP